MGLEVTVLVVLLSRCSYMTEERERERARGRGWIGERGVESEIEREKWEEDGRKRGWWRSVGER